MGEKKLNKKGKQKHWKEKQVKGKLRINFIFKKMREKRGKNTEEKIKEK